MEITIYILLVLLVVMVAMYLIKNKRYNRLLKASNKQREANDKIKNKLAMTRLKQEEKELIKQLAIERKQKQKIIDRAYKDTRKYITDPSSKLFNRVFSELVKEYLEEEEHRKEYLNKLD